MHSDFVTGIVQLVAVISPEEQSLLDIMDLFPWERESVQRYADWCAANGQTVKLERARELLRIIEMTRGAFGEPLLPTYQDEPKTDPIEEIKRLLGLSNVGR